MYEQTLAAVAAEEHSSWDVAFALADEIPEPTPQGTVAAVVDVLAEHGYARSSSYVHHLLGLGRWVPKRSRGPASRHPIGAMKVLKAVMTYQEAKDGGWLEKTLEMSQRDLKRELGFAVSEDRVIDNNDNEITDEQVQQAVKENPAIVLDDADTTRALGKEELARASSEQARAADERDLIKLSTEEAVDAASEAAGTPKRHPVLGLLSQVESILGEALWWIEQKPLGTDAELDVRIKIERLKVLMDSMLQGELLTQEDHDWLDQVGKGISQ